VRSGASQILIHAENERVEASIQVNGDSTPQNRRAGASLVCGTRGQ
jgi:hypothetical protein